MRGEGAKDGTFRNIFSRTLVITGNLQLMLGACQEELFHLEPEWNILIFVIREL